ncbi:hypothetical protein AMS68_005889 [Peltaster fructicola]|uniref:Lethal giant larvae (Lgl)-like C-terminal domain-containing protein n=1 Tax=Peltaster fructicola TaxID=286661 RepID=A0A6H0Y016_9PEZI|nr:hypothetical protein AMS68_005889 [Peltaster fructicola]
MAGLLRSRQAGISNDLSAGLTSDLFVLDALENFGVNSQISTLAYDPVQSLLAVGTRSSQFGPGCIYLYGQKRVCVCLQLPPRGASVTTLQFCAEKLICLDSKHDVSIYSLESKKLLATYSPPGVVTAICTDPMLDYALIGLQTGNIIAYDIDREAPTAFTIQNLWTEVEPRARPPIVALQLHPKDIGTLLIGYGHGAVLYSFKANKSIRHYHYEIPARAPGGDGSAVLLNTIRRPRLTHVAWHPSGTFVLTGHEDSSLVFWDVLKDGRMISARTRTDVDIATPGSAPVMNPQDVAGPKEPIFRISWCANGQNPDDTGVLIAGGASADAVTKGLCFLELGPTPIYATSNWEGLAAHFDSPKRQRILPTPPGAEVINFCPIPRTSPHFAGGHDPIAIITLLSSGELLTLSFPSGIPISPSNQLHPGLTFVHPFLQKVTVTAMGRERWLGMTENRQQGPLICKGGMEAPHLMKRYERRNVIQAAHGDGTLRIWDIGHGDEIENDKMVQVDVARALGRFTNVDIVQMSQSGESGELAVGTRNGEVIAFRWGRNRFTGRERPEHEENRPGQLTGVAHRIEPTLKEGLLPLTLLDQQNGPTTAVKMSDVGFVAAGFEGGSIVVIDLRGPAIILNTNVAEFARSEKQSTFRKRTSNPLKADWAVQMEFSVMTLEGEQWSSILLHVGTAQGVLATFKVVPDPSGRYTVQFVGTVSLDARVVYIHPINIDTGSPAFASQHAVAALRSGGHVNGSLVVATINSIHIFKPATSKGAHKSFDSYFCDAAGIIRFQDQGHAILGLFGDGSARAFSIPALKELAVIKLADRLDVRRFADAAISPAGDIIAYTGPSELAVLSVFGTGETLIQDNDTLWNPAALLPPRPTISAVSWVTGTQYVTPLDMDTLIGGPGRPPSKRMIAQAQADEAQRRAGIGSATQQDEGYMAYMQRQIQERTAKLGSIGDTMENLETTSQNWLQDVNKYVGQQKRSAATGCPLVQALEHDYLATQPKSSSVIPLSDPNSRYAYVTLLAPDRTHNPDIYTDNYFTGIRILAYQILHAKETKSEHDVPFIVLAVNGTSQAKKDRLRRDGATILEIDSVPLPSWMHAMSNPAWTNIFDKLRMWELTQFERVIFVDADVLLTKPLDGAFESAVKLTDFSKSPSTGKLPEEYVLLAGMETAVEHHFPPTLEGGDFERGEYFNAGFMVIKPSHSVLEYYLSVLNTPNAFDTEFAEQDMLNAIHRLDGPMPFEPLDPIWNIHRPMQADLDAGVHSVHAKWWILHHQDLAPYMAHWRWKMEGYFEAWDASHA